MKARQKGKQNKKFDKLYKALGESLFKIRPKARMKTFTSWEEFSDEFILFPEALLDEIREIKEKAEENKRMDKYRQWLEEGEKSDYTYNGPLCGPVK